jgi:hypothetical protein
MYYKKNLTVDIHDVDDNGIGKTGQIGRIDPANNTGNVNEIFVTIYNSKNNSYHSFKINTLNTNRLECKKEIVDSILEELLNIL